MSTIRTKPPSKEYDEGYTRIFFDSGWVCDICGQKVMNITKKHVCDTSPFDEKYDYDMDYMTYHDGE